MNKKSYRDEALRRLRAHKYEVTDQGGILIPAMGLTFAGHWETQVNDDPWAIDPNIVVNEGILHLLTVALDQGSANSAFYVAIFSGAVTPVATWTAANFTANATESTDYDEATRVLWANDAAASNAIGNTTTAALFTITSGSTIRGAALLSASAKSATTGVLIAAARFSADKTLGAAEELRVKYTLTGTSS